MRVMATALLVLLLAVTGCAMLLAHAAPKNSQAVKMLREELLPFVPTSRLWWPDVEPPVPRSDRYRVPTDMTRRANISAPA